MAKYLYILISSVYRIIMELHNALILYLKIEAIQIGYPLQDNLEDKYWNWSINIYIDTTLYHFSLIIRLVFHKYNSLVLNNIHYLQIHNSLYSDYNKLNSWRYKTLNIIFYIIENITVINPLHYSSLFSMKPYDLYHYWLSIITILFSLLLDNDKYYSNDSIKNEIDYFKTNHMLILVLWYTYFDLLILTNLLNWYFLLFYCLDTYIEKTSYNQNQYHLHTTI